MPNHIHLLIRQVKDDGIKKFMIKVGTGYARYFNVKYSRKGYLFQNRFRSVHIKDDRQFQIIFRYIHANPISLIESGWKEDGIKNPKKITKFLEKYKWSSYQDYIGIKNFPSVTERDFVSETIGGATGCREVLYNWVDYKTKLENYREILLD
jgi:putative transposase